MRLEKIEINGFKSFADKTEIILEKGITGIVGPNGSGKSNIADAVRWVLGEQSSKNLRGEKMEDVIFGGTQTRRKKSYCEVALYFDNSDKKIRADYSEIVIARKMFRSGESEYTLNRTPVRLRDIVDMMRDTGIGKEGYSIVGQGRIDEILSSKPLARRRVFEEAAGVMKYRARKEEAERKLERTQDNLIRIEDIIEELDTQIEPLKEQADRTREYLTLFERQKVLDAKMYVINYERVNKRLIKLRQEASQVDAEIAQDKLTFGDSIENIDHLNVALEEIEQKLAIKREKRAELLSEIARISGEASLYDERIGTAKNNIARLQMECENIENSINEAKLSKEAYKKELAAQEEEAALLQSKIETATKKRDEISAQYSEKRREVQALRDAHMQLLEQISASKSALSRLQERQENALLDERSTKERLAENENLMVQEAEALSVISKNIEQLKEAQKQAMQSRNEKASQLLQLNEEKQSITKQIDEINTKYRDAVSRNTFLENLKKEYEGYSAGVRNLMNSASKVPAIAKGMLGTFAELVRVPKKYQDAIEAVLGGAMQNVVVQTDADAKAAVAHLRKNKLGRVSFMPLNALKVRTLSKKEEDSFGNEGLVCAADAVEFDAHLRPAVEFLLGRTVIVRNMDDAVTLARRASYSYRIVTLEGDVVNSGGTITGGSNGKRSFGLLSREQEIAEAKQTAESAKKQLAQLSATLSDLDAKSKEQELLAQTELETLKQYEIKLAEENANITAANQRKQNIENTLQQLQSVQVKSAEETAQTIGAIAAHESVIAENEKELVALQIKLDAEEQLDDSKLRAQEEVLAALRVDMATIKSHTNAVQENITRVTGEIAGSTNRLQVNKEQIAAQNTQILEITQAQIGSGENVQLLQENEAALLKEIEQLEVSRKVQSEEIARIQKDGAEFQLRQTTLLDQKYKTESQIERLALSLENTGNKLWEDYGMTYADAEQVQCDMSYTACAAEVSDIRERIRNLGTVNPNALEDYKRVYERHEELTTQKADLEAAKNDLYKVIAAIVDAMRIAFKDKFVQINENFQSVFTTLFGGGRAALLLDAEDIMECGIEIEAEPPGKKLQNISLLSGGERALTGIALLFAMIQINPSPVCILDEIDAPLDEANVVRFGNYIKTIINMSQYVVITHRKPTMSICDTLYGVAMEEKGVSKLVSVKLEA